MSRTIARENLYKLIYEYLFTMEANERTFEIFSVGLDETDVEYMQKVYYGVIDKFDDLNDTVEKYSNAFALHRIFRLDLAALLLAIYEMKYVSDIPLSVSISEAVELVKRFSTEKSNQYVNGILSSVYKELQGGKKE